MRVGSTRVDPNNKKLIRQKEEVSAQPALSDFKALKEEPKQVSAKELSSAHPAFSEFKASAEDSFKQQLSFKPSWGVKDFVQLARLMRNHMEIPGKEFSARWKRYLADTDPFVKKQGYSLAFFCSKFDSYIAPPALPHMRLY